MTRAIHFHLELPVAELVNSNSREHWSRKAKKRAAMRALTARTVTDAGLPSIAPPVRIAVRFLWPDSRKRDVDNYECKGLIDGVVDAGIIPDDNDEVVAGGVLRLPSKDRSGVAKTVRLHVSVETVEEV